MVVTRSQDTSNRCNKTIENILKDVNNLDDGSELYVSNICTDLNKIRTNYPDINIGQLDIAISKLIASLNEAMAENIAVKRSADTYRIQIEVLESKLHEEKGRRIADFNDSINIQESIIEEKDTLLNEIDNLKSKISSIKNNLSHSYELNKSLEISIAEKNNEISDLNLRVNECNKQIINLNTLYNNIKLQLKQTEERSWHSSRWLDDNILNSYFQAFSESHSSSLSKTIFFGPSLTEIIKHGDPKDIVTLTDQLLFHSSNFAFFCINNSSECLKDDSGSHWSLLFLDLIRHEAFHFDSISGSNHAFAVQVLNKLNMDSSCLREVECTQQKNNFECGISVLTYCKFINDTFCSREFSVEQPFHNWYHSLLHPNNINVAQSIVNSNYKESANVHNHNRVSVSEPVTSKPISDAIHNDDNCMLKLNESIVYDNSSSVGNTSYDSLYPKKVSPIKVTKNSGDWTVIKPKARTTTNSTKNNVNKSLTLVNRFNVLNHSNESILSSECNVYQSDVKYSKNIKQKSNKLFKNAKNNSHIADTFNNHSKKLNKKCNVNTVCNAQSDNLESVRNGDIPIPNKVRLVSDSHGKKLSSLLIYNQPTLNVRGHTIPNGNTCQVLHSAVSELEELGKDDYLVIMAGTNDLQYNITNIDMINQIESFLRKPTSCRVCIVGIPFRYDTFAFNKNICFLNSQLKNLCLKYDHATFMSISHFSRSLFTRHGLHLNLFGKRALARLISHKITSHTPQLLLKSTHSKLHHLGSILPSCQVIRHNYKFNNYLQKENSYCFTEHHSQAANKETVVRSRYFNNSSMPFLNKLMPPRRLR